MIRPNKERRITLRKAMAEDCRRLWDWRNEQDTRQASFQTDFIPFDQHEQWFKAKLEDACTRVLIAVDAQGHEVGCVRFDIRGREAAISVSIDRDERGKGYGREAIRRGSEYLMEEGSIERIIAQIRADNVTSREVFQRAGYTLRAREQVCGEDACEMVYERKGPSDRKA